MIKGESKVKRKHLLLVSLVLALAMFVSACSNGNQASGGESTTPAEATTGEVKVLKLGHQAPAGTAYDDLATTFKKYIEERTDGRYEVDVYNGGQLGGDRELMEALQVGNVEFNILTASDMGMFAPEMEVQDLPYLFDDWDQVFKFLESDASIDFYALSDEAGIKTLSFMPRGFRHVTNNAGPINTPDDIAGKKMRVAESAIYVDTFEAFGANALALAWGEVFTALQQGTVDGHENTIVTIKDYKIEEVQDYLSKTGHMFGFAAITVNPAFFEALSPEDQEIFQNAAIDAAVDVGAIQQENEVKASNELEAAGMQFNEVDKEAFKALVQPVYDKYFETHDKQYFDAIKAAVAE
jgi:tripartite ATP-independent transporter DctP family solute receptor